MVSHTQPVDLAICKDAEPAAIHKEFRQILSWNGLRIATLAPRSSFQFSYVSPDSFLTVLQGHRNAREGIATVLREQHTVIFSLHIITIGTIVSVVITINVDDVFIAIIVGDRAGRIWKRHQASLRVQRAAHAVCLFDVHAHERKKEAAVAAVEDVPYTAAAEVDLDAAAAADGGGELRRVWARHEAHEGAVVEAEERERVEGAEPAEKVRGGGDLVPLLADGGGADEGGGEAQAEKDLAEDVAVVEHHGDQSSRCDGRGLRRGDELRALALRLHRDGGSGESRVDWFPVRFWGKGSTSR